MIFLGSMTFCSAQEPIFLDNPVKLLRQLQVKKVIEDSTFEYILEHSLDRTRISYQGSYYEYLYSESADYQEITDSVLILIDYFEDHYFNTNSLVDSSFYFTSYADSLEIDTSKVNRYFYNIDGDLWRMSELTYLNDTTLRQIDYNRTGKRIDSIFEYSNVTPGTFGPSHHDSLQLIQKVRYTYDSIGRKTEKLKYWTRKGTLIESYDYPKENTIITTQAPYHPIRGCIKDLSTSFSILTIEVRDKKGLLQEGTVYHRKKQQNEDWNNGEPFTFLLRYEIKKRYNKK